MSRAVFRVTMYRASGSFRCVIRDFEDKLASVGVDENPMRAFAKAEMDLERQGGGLGNIIMNGDPADWRD